LPYSPYKIADESGLPLSISPYNEGMTEIQRHELADRVRFLHLRVYGIGLLICSSLFAIPFSFLHWDVTYAIICSITWSCIVAQGLSRCLWGANCPFSILEKGIRYTDFQSDSRFWRWLCNRYGRKAALWTAAIQPVALGLLIEVVFAFLHLWHGSNWVSFAVAGFVFVMIGAEFLIVHRQRRERLKNELVRSGC
jgi:hypothetical protein